MTVSDQKHAAITAAATSRFLRDGFTHTSVDQIASDAAVSKQTVYKHFADKEQLFREIVLGVTANSDAILSELTSVLDGTQIQDGEDLRVVLTDLARQYIQAVLRTNVLALRRLVISEAERFPDLARTYYEQAPARAIDLIAGHFAGLAARGLLTTDDPRLAAAHFAYLTLAIPQDRALFCPEERPGPQERERLATEATRVFLAAYGA